MQALPQTRGALRPHLEYGVVAEDCGELFSVSCPLGVIAARQAVSCVVRPVTGDQVLLSVDALDRMHGAFVLAILARRPEDAAMGTDLAFQGTVRLHTSGGDLSLSSEGNVHLCAANEAGIMAESVAMQADNVDMEARRLGMTAKVLNVKAACVNRVADVVHDICNRLTQRFIHAVRYVRDREEVQAGALRCVVEETLTIHAKNAVHVSEEITKIDAGQVHIG